MAIIKFPSSRYVIVLLMPNDSAAEHISLITFLINCFSVLFETVCGGGLVERELFFERSIDFEEGFRGMVGMVF